MEAESEKKSAGGEIFHTPENSRAIVYVDGFNLYYGVNSLGRPRLKWLDIGKLGATLAGGGECTVKYFTAMIRNDPEKLRRQKHYHLALRAACPSLEFIYGKLHFKEKFWCPACGQGASRVGCEFCEERYKIPQEKQTDVNIAFHLTRDFDAGAFDRAFVVSNDSDLMLPVSEIAAAPGRKIFVVLPPRRRKDKPKKRGQRGDSRSSKHKNSALAEQANDSHSIDEKMLMDCLLPKTVIIGNGKTLSMPEKWDADSRRRPQKKK